MIRHSFLIACFIYIIGIIAFYFASGVGAALWFGVGGAMALLNFLVASSLVQFGLTRLKKAPLILALIFMKTLIFLVLVVLVLSYAKPQLLPFTLGIGLVIFGLILWATLEGRKLVFGKIDRDG